MKNERKKTRVGVVGATGYTGEELVRLLSRHPGVELAYVSSKEDREIKIQEIFPYLRLDLDLDCRPLSIEEAIEKTDLVFLSLPHTVSMEVAPLFLRAKKKVVDISADYRLRVRAVYEKFYKAGHKDPAHLKEAVYGLPESNREKIRSARLVANPGCYPTGAILGLLPGLAAKLFEPDEIIIDAKSGVTGAGRKAEKALNFSEVNESFRAYKILQHQHAPEIEQALSSFAKKDVKIVFVPHLLPLNRGILSTIYVKLNKKMETKELHDLYRKFYRQEPFVKVYETGRWPELRSVAYTNFCDIAVAVDGSKRLGVIVTAIDNLGKGAAGQAVQNMNIVLGLDETSGFSGDLRLR